MLLLFNQQSQQALAPSLLLLWFGEGEAPTVTNILQPQGAPWWEEVKKREKKEDVPKNVESFDDEVCLLLLKAA